MGMERRGQVIAVEPGPTGYAGRSPIVQRKAAALVRWMSRMMREYHVRFCEVLGGTVRRQSTRVECHTSLLG